MTATTNVMSDLNRLREAAEGEYLALVESVAGGEPVDAPTVAGVLREAGKTADQFQADVARKAERFRLKALADGYADRERQLLAARADVERLEAELGGVTAKLSAAIRDGQCRCEELVQAMAEAKQAGRGLMNTYVGPLKEQAAEVRRRMDAADRQMAAARREVQRLEHNLRVATADPDTYTPTDAERVGNVLAGYRRDLAAAEAERDAALAESNRLTDAMRQP